MTSANSFLATLRLTAVAFTSTVCLSLLPADAYAQTGLPPLSNPVWSWSIGLNDPTDEDSEDVYDVGNDASDGAFAYPDAHAVTFEDNVGKQDQHGQVFILEPPYQSLELLEADPVYLPSIGPFVYTHTWTENGIGLGVGDIQTRAFLQYDFRTRKVFQDIQPPFTPTEIPLVAFVQLQAFVDANFPNSAPSLFEAAAVARLSIREKNSSPVIQNREAGLLSNGGAGLLEDTHVELGFFDALSNHDYRVVLEAITTLRRVPTGYFAEAFAYADPLITFDQATFDATWGENSFPLADYYEIEHSPGIVFAPEPSTLLMAVVGIMCLLSQRALTRLAGNVEIRPDFP